MPGLMSHWSDAYKQEVRRLYESGLSTTDIYQKLGVPKPTVRGWVNTWGISRSSTEGLALARSKGKGRALGEKVYAQIRDLYVQGLSCPDIAGKLGLKVGAVTGVINRAGLIRSQSVATRMVAERIGNTLRKYTINPNAFDELNPNSAWALGVLFGDGHISRYKGRLNGVVVSGDKDVCLKVSAVVGSDAPTKKPDERNMYQAVFNSPALAVNVGKLGVVPKKSRIIRWPSLPEDLVPHFLRGFLDADGTVTMSQGRYLFIAFSSVSYVFMAKVSKVVQSVTGSEAEVTSASDGTNRVGVACKMARTLAKWLWGNSTENNRGERKYNLAMKIIQEGEERGNFLGLCTQCSVYGCDRKYYGRGLCRLHWQRERRERLRAATV